MSIVRALARRFLFSRSTDGFLSFIAWVSVVGVALGVLALTVVTSVINGFEGELTNVITGMNGDVVLYSRGEPIGDQAEVERRIREVVPQTQAITASFVTELMVAGPNGVAGGVIEGIDSETIGLVTAVPKRLRAGRLPVREGEVTLGSALAERIGAKLDTEVRLIAPFFNEAEQPDPAQGQGASAQDSAEALSEDETSMGTPRSIKATVVGIVNMGMYEYDSKFIFASLGGVQSFLEQPDKVTSFKIKVAPGTDTLNASNRLGDTFGYPFRAKDWGQLNKNLFYAIKLEKVVIAIILTVIVIVAAFNVVSTLMMMIHDKTKEISILKTMGFKPSQSFALFCLIGMSIGVVGISIGVAGGIGVNAILERFRLIQLPPEIYYIGFLPVVVRWNEVAMIAGVALLVTFFATVYPAIKVSRRSPLDGIRYE